MNGKPLPRIPLLILSIAVSLATFMIVLDYSIANVSIPYISGDLGVSNQQGTYVITSFAVGNAIALPLTGWLTKRIGAIRLIVLSLLFFVLFSIACGGALNYNMLVISRFFQGFVAGPLIPLSQTLIITTHPPEKKNAALALWSAIIITAPIFGPILGGWISYDYTWPWIFYINIPVGLISAFVIWTIMSKRETPIEKEPIDWVGLIFLILFVTCLQLLLDLGEQYNWFHSNGMRTLAVGSSLGFIFLIVWSLNTKKPLIELSLMKIMTFSLSILFIAISYGIYFGTVVLIPLWLQEYMGYTSIWAGLAVCPIGIAPLCFSKPIGKLVARFGTIPLLGICFILFAVSCFYTAYFDTDVDFYTIGFSRFLLGCALIFLITPLISLSVLDLPEEKLPSGTGIFHFVRALFGGVGTSIFTTLWIRRTQYHHQILGEHLTPFSSQWNMYLNQLNELGFKGKQALEIANETVDKQAAMLAQNDCFYVMGWIFIGLLLFLPLASWQKTSRKHI